MLFNSYIFIGCFLPVTLLGFFVLSRLPDGHRLAKAWLVVASLAYYGWWHPVYVTLIVASMLFNFGSGRWIWRLRARPAGAQTLMLASVTANLALLGYFKYANFFVDTVNAVVQTGWHMDKVLLPIGISFFTFTQIAYLVDVRRGVVSEGDLADYVLFVTFFPHLIAGPILHHAEMMPQFARRETYQFRWDNQAVGLTLFAFGLVKKVMIADALSDHVARVFQAAAAGAALRPVDAWAGVFCYTFQIYFDFSGYSDMALGLGRMFGIILPLNFNSPYQAVDLVDFWRRWHITLSRFLRDYVYIPLGGNRRGPVRRYVHLLVTMLLGGLWHGAGWTFILWGALHGAGLAVNHLLYDLFPRLRPKGVTPAGPGAWIGRALTLLFIMAGWVLFRAGSLPTVGTMLAAMTHLGALPAAGAPALLKTNLWLWIAGLLALVWFAPNSAQVTAAFHPALLTYQEKLPAPARWLRWTPAGSWAFATGLGLAVCLLSLSRAGEFLYYNF